MTWVVVQTLAMVDMVETVDKVAMAKEVVAKVPVQPCLKCIRGWCLQGPRGAHFHHQLGKQWQEWQYALHLNG
jgi:hypothetical protein